MEKVSRMIEDMRRPGSLLTFEDIASYLEALDPIELSKVLNDCIVTTLVIGKLSSSLPGNKDKRKMAPLIAALMASAMMEASMTTFKVGVTTVMEALEYNPVILDTETKEQPSIYKTNFYNN